MDLLGGYQHLQTTLETLEEWYRDRLPPKGEVWQNRIAVREILGWYGAKRRSPQLVEQFESDLEGKNLVVELSLVEVGINGSLHFQLGDSYLRQLFDLIGKSYEDHFGGDIDGGLTVVNDTISVAEEPQDREESGEESRPPEAASHAPLIENSQAADPIHRISRISSATAGVISVSPSDPLSTAIYTMLSKSFSQLPVIEGRHLKGILTWDEIAKRLFMGAGSDGKVSDFLEPAVSVARSDESLFSATELVSKFGYVLVESRNQIIGIVTAEDLVDHFRQLAEPFLHIGVIEGFMRSLIGKVGLEGLQEWEQNQAPRSLTPALAKLSFGDYLSILRSDRCWGLADLKIDQKLFVKDLDFVREIRNDVAHFHPDGITDEETKTLRDFVGLLHSLRKLAQL
jgi:predicted transcriptional regulator